MRHEARTITVLRLVWVFHYTGLTQPSTRIGATTGRLRLKNAIFCCSQVLNRKSKIKNQLTCVAIRDTVTRIYLDIKNIYE